MFSEKLSKLLNAVPFLTVSHILLGTILVNPSQAMLEESDRQSQVASQKWAPFSAEDVIAHAATYPTIMPWTI